MCALSASSAEEFLCAQSCFWTFVFFISAPSLCFMCLFAIPPAQKLGHSSLPLQCELSILRPWEVESQSVLGVGTDGVYHPWPFWLIDHLSIQLSSAQCILMCPKMSLCCSESQEVGIYRKREQVPLLSGFWVGFGQWQRCREMTKVGSR